MYNYQTFCREQEVLKQCQAFRKDQLRAEIKRQQSTPALVHAHKKRIEGFILSAIEKPLPVTQHTNHPHSFRTIDSSHNVATKGFYLRRETEAQRIESQLKKNSDLDQVPFHNTFSHHFRDDSGKGMRYKPVTHGMRIKEYLERQELNYLPNCTPKPERSIRKADSTENSELSSLNHSMSKSLLPMLHAKTYFKSVGTLFTEISWGKADRSRDEGVEEDGERRTKPNDHLSRKQNSRQALLKCNMLTQKLRA